jgi:hypothetical protein
MRCPNPLFSRMNPFRTGGDFLAHHLANDFRE